MESKRLPNSWDCHTHVLDPTRFHYRHDRKYTPAAASLHDLIESDIAENVVIVQATPEDGETGLLFHLEEAQTVYPNRTFRGIIMADTSSSKDVRSFDRQRIDRLHKAGVRGIRVQGVYSSVGSEELAVQKYLEHAAACYPIKDLDWIVSMQIPLQTWACLRDFLVNSEELEGVRIIADHNGSAKPGDLDSPAFEAFLDILRQRRNTFVKIGALYRRTTRDCSEMQGIVRALTKAAPGGIVWGSDWPYVNTGRPMTEIAPHLQDVSAIAELKTIKQWLSDEAICNMLVNNPAQLFV